MDTRRYIGILPAGALLVVLTVFLNCGESGSGAALALDSDAFAMTCDKSSEPADIAGPDLPDTRVSELPEPGFDLPGEPRLLVDLLQDKAFHGELPPDELVEIEVAVELSVLEALEQVGGPEVDATTDAVSPIPDLSKDGVNCSEMLACGVAASCGGAEDEGCWSDCTADASELGQWKLDLVGACYDEHCTDAEAGEEELCRQQHCVLEILVCVGGEGALDCGGTLDCLTECSMASMACPLECMAQADSDAIDSAYLVAMAQGEHPLEVWIITCLGGSGEMDCAEARECFMGCGYDAPADEMNPPCFVACVENTSAEAKEQWLEMMACCEDEVDHSLMVVCAGGQGDLTCPEVVQCSEPCGPTTPGCFDTCLSKTAPESIQAVHDFFKCMEELCPTDFFPACPYSDVCMPHCSGQDAPDG